MIRTMQMLRLVKMIVDSEALARSHLYKPQSANIYTNIMNPSWFSRISNHVGFQEGEAEARVFSAEHAALYI